MDFYMAPYNKFIISNWKLLGAKQINEMEQL